MSGGSSWSSIDKSKALSGREKGNYYKQLARSGGFVPAPVEYMEKIAQGSFFVEKEGGRWKEREVDGSEEDWFLAGKSNSVKSAETLEQMEVNEKISSSQEVMDTKNDSGKTYGLDEIMGEIDTSFNEDDAAEVEKYSMEYHASDKYYDVTGKKKPENQKGSAGDVSTSSYGKGESLEAQKSREEAMKLKEEDEQINKMASGQDDNYYIGSDNLIKLRKKQVALTGYDGGVQGAHKSGYRS